MKRGLIICLVLLAAGCSNRAIYESVQLSKRNSCAELPPSQYDECMTAASKTYTEYKRERDAAIKH